MYYWGDTWPAPPTRSAVCPTDTRQVQCILVVRTSPWTELPTSRTIRAKMEVRSKTPYRKIEGRAVGATTGTDTVQIVESEAASLK